MRASVSLATVALVMVAGSRNATAGDSEHTRTPVQWDDVACMEFVDRSVEPNYALSYGIPYEDTDVTSDEVGDSRTHQFFALCQQTYLHEEIPRWISMADVEETMLSYEDFDTPPDDEIFERATGWDGCWHRINEDADRRPITDAMASQPVNWDTRAVPVGVYLLLGYTYEPPFNLWTPRAGGVVRVHDGGDPEVNGPAAAITTAQQSVCPGDAVRIDGCVSALPGTTMTASYTTNPGPDPSDSTWTPFLEGVPVEGSTFALDWEAPPEVSVVSTILRLDFTDPNGAKYTAYQYDPIIVLSSESAGCTDEPDDEPDDELDDEPEDEPDDEPVGCIDGLGTDASCEEPDNVGALGDDRSGCRLQGTPRAGWGALGLLGLFVLRRNGFFPRRGIDQGRSNRLRA